MATSGCAAEPAFVRLSEARSLAAELLVQFAKTSDATNRVIMADTDERSAAFARENEEATQAVQRTTDTLKPLLADLGYSPEGQLLDQFSQAFSEYRVLDRRILELAVENTNVKAHRLSVGPAHEAASAFRGSLEAVARAAPARDEWRIRALTATAVAAVREIQVLEGSHVPEADEAVMTRLEKQMAAAEGEARSALATLQGAVPPGARSRFVEAVAALDRFMDLHAQIVRLSRRNSNVQSLTLAFGEKERLAAGCEEKLWALQEALAKRGSGGTR